MIFKQQICRWSDHKAITIIAENETASCRIHIYDEEPDMAVISDLYVAQGERQKGIATKKFIIEAEEGCTKCTECPFDECRCFELGYVDAEMDCGKYNLATMKIKSMEEEKCLET